MPGGDVRMSGELAVGRITQPSRRLHNRTTTLGEQAAVNVRAKRRWALASVSALYRLRPSSSPCTLDRGETRVNLTPQRWQHGARIDALAVEVAPHPRDELPLTAAVPLSTGPFDERCGPLGHSSKFCGPFSAPPVRNVALRRCDMPREESMKNNIATSIGLCLLLLVSWPRAAAADSVITWNENAAKAATAACLHISGNGLAESRMYAMVHVAVHDAVNAIDRRSRPYAFEANVNGPVSVDAAVAAAARDVLVSVIATLPESPACVMSGIVAANALYAAALIPIPNGPAKTAGVALGQAAAAAIVKLRAGDGSETTTWLDFDYPQGTKPGEWRFTPDGPPLAFASNYGRVKPFVLAHSGQFWPGPPYRSAARGTQTITTRSS